MRVVFVGEAPNRARKDGKPFPALWPFVPGSGARLCGYLGIAPRQFWRRRREGELMTVNLFEQPVARWDQAAAEMMAWNMCDEIRKFRKNESVVLVYLGRRVAKAMNFDRPFFTVELYFKREASPDTFHVVVPHPSGRSRAWNDRRNVAKFRKTMRELGVISTINAGGD